ncbi:MAG: NF038143 family protein [Desulfobacterales bacterium]
MADDYYKKFKIIFERERSMAQGLAASLIRPKTLTVWEIMIPVIFILNYAKLKQSREVFIQNQMFTKKMALDAALDMQKKDASKETVMVQIQSKTKELVTSVPGGIYSDDIRRQQLKEIDLLVDHYTRLLNAEGKDYASLVTYAYQTAADYSSFLEALKSAENEVMGAARRTLGDQTDMTTAAKIESITANMRTAEVKKIFSSDSQPQDAE